MSYGRYENMTNSQTILFEPVSFLMFECKNFTTSNAFCKSKSDNYDHSENPTLQMEAEGAYLLFRRKRTDREWHEEKRRVIPPRVNARNPPFVQEYSVETHSTPPRTEINLPLDIHSSGWFDKKKQIKTGNGIQNSREKFKWKTWAAFTYVVRSLVMQSKMRLRLKRKIAGIASRVFSGIHLNWNQISLCKTKIYWNQITLAS